MRIFSYLRVSGLGQVDKDGPTRQRAAIEAFCGKHSLDSSFEFFEEGVSGTVDGMDRPKFAEMVAKIDLLRAEPILAVEAIVVESMDRLARDLMVSEFLLKECRERGIKVFIANSGDLVDVANDGGDPTRAMLRQILGAISQWDKSVTVRKLRSARLRARSDGNRCEGAKPYGYNEAEAIVKSRMQSFKNKGFSYANIAIELNAERFRTRFHKQWSEQTVRSVLKARRIKRKG
jgi:DNA invertase Pin-like site-specific DNA recombinase